MELKPQSFLLLLSTFPLLIVPYGIETKIGISLRFMIDLLLIVPYGIETTNTLRWI